MRNNPRVSRRVDVVGGRHDSQGSGRKADRIRHWVELVSQLWLTALAAPFPLTLKSILGQPVDSLLVPA